MADRFSPAPLSLPSDHMMMLGWFLSRSTVRRMRSTSASRQTGSAGGVRPPPGRWVGRLPPPLQREEAVRLEVALVDDVEAELVAQLEEARVRRVVRRAHRVDVVGLHELDVAAHHVLADGAPGQRVELVPVDAVQLDAVPVDL